MKRELLLIRYYQDIVSTLGIFVLKDYYGMPIFCLENPQMINNPKLSCIPEGRYKCTPTHYDNDRHRYKINGVHELHTVEIKACSLLPQSYGNILVGHGINNSNYDPIITNGTHAINALRDYFNDKEFELNITKVEKNKC